MDWAYDTSNNFIPLDILQIADDVKTIGGEQTLCGTFDLWREIFRNPDRKLPLPSLSHIIPKTHAHWNSVKGGSDTTTKLMDDSVCLHPPYVNCETIACARILLLLFVTIHRLSQVISAKEDLGFYDSLYHFRNSASKRSTFAHTLDSIREHFEEELESIKKNTLNSSSSKESNEKRQLVPSRKKFGESFQIYLLLEVHILASHQRETKEE